MAHITTLTRAHTDIYNSNANTYSYSGSFETFKETEVIVKLDGVALTYQSGTINESASPRQYTVNLTDKTIHIGGGNLSSGTISIYPETDLGDPTLKAPYTAGSAITASDLTNNQKQVMRKAMELDGNKLSSQGGTMTGHLTMGEDQTIIFEGATDDAYETTLTVTDPTADRTITLPNVTGTVVTTGDTGTVAHAMLAGDAVDGDNIADNSVNSEHYVDGSIDTAHIANSQITTAKIADSTGTSDGITTAKIADNAVTNAKIANSSITAAKLGTVNIADLSDVHTATPNDGQVLKWANSNSRWEPANDIGGGGGSGISELLDDTSPQLGGNLDTHTRNIFFGDSSASSDDRLTFGAGTDLSIYHDGTDNFIDTVTNKLRIRVDNSDDAIVANTNGSVELYHNSSKKIETATGGVTVSGDITLNSTTPTVSFVDSDANPDYEIKVDGGVFEINDATNNQSKFSISSGELAANAKLNCQAGLDTDGDVQFNSGTTNANMLWDVSAKALTFDDTVSATFGTGGDLQILHNGTDSVINDAGSGNLKFMLGGATKAELVSGGFTITGTCTATDFAGDGSALTGIAAGATGGGSDEVFWENGQTVTTNYTITNNKNAMSAGPITINNGIAVTIGTGENWTIV